MGLFETATNQQSKLKAGFMGFAGSGKTYTAATLAIGLVEYMRKHKIDGADKPVMFFDTENGSDWVIDDFNDADIELKVGKSRAFADLVPAVNTAEQEASVLIIDSISHPWKELMDSYSKKMGRNKGLLFHDWAWLKGQWSKYTDAFLNSDLHIIMCGRAGYEYDYFENEGGKKELEKTGIKMKAEGETGFEPSLTVYMESHTDLDTNSVYRTATIFKDRSKLIDGKVFRNPTFQDFLPHIHKLNMQGTHRGFDESRSSENMVPKGGKSQYQRDKEEKEIVLDEIQQFMVKHFPSSSAIDKQAKSNIIENVFDTRSWKRVQTFDLNTLQNGLALIEADIDSLAQSPNGDEPADHEPETGNKPVKKKVSKKKVAKKVTKKKVAKETGVTQEPESMSDEELDSQLP